MEETPQPAPQTPPAEEEPQNARADVAEGIFWLLLAGVVTSNAWVTQAALSPLEPATHGAVTPDAFNRMVQVAGGMGKLFWIGVLAGLGPVLFRMATGFFPLRYLVEGPTPGDQRLRWWEDGKWMAAISGVLATVIPTTTALHDLAQEEARLDLERIQVEAQVRQTYLDTFAGGDDIATLQKKISYIKAMLHQHDEQAKRWALLEARSLWYRLDQQFRTTSFDLVRERIALREAERTYEALNRELSWAGELRDELSVESASQRVLGPLDDLADELLTLVNRADASRKSSGERVDQLTRVAAIKVEHLDDLHLVLSEWVGTDEFPDPSDFEERVARECRAAVEGSGALSDAEYQRLHQLTTCTLLGRYYADDRLPAEKRALAAPSLVRACPDLPDDPWSEFSEAEQALAVDRFPLTHFAEQTWSNPGDVERLAATIEVRRAQTSSPSLTEACWRLGRQLRQPGFQRNVASRMRASRYYEYACYMGDPNGCNGIGIVLYEAGMADPQNRPAHVAIARRLFEGACAEGSSKACDSLAQVDHDAITLGKPSIGDPSHHAFSNYEGPCLTGNLTSCLNRLRLTALVDYKALIRNGHADDWVEDPSVNDASRVHAILTRAIDRLYPRRSAIGERPAGPQPKE